VPEFLADNSRRWVHQFLGQKTLQSVFLDFHARLDQLFKTECKVNRTQVQAYLTSPHTVAVNPGKKGSQRSFGGLSGSPTVVNARFLDELPRLYKKKEEKLIKIIRKAIQEDNEVLEQFDIIVNNPKFNFN
jgi:hypothetical protein